MPKRDITGKEFYKDITLRSKKRETDNYCFIGVRTTFDMLGFFLEIYNNTDYLFELSEFSLDVVIDSENFVFKSFLFKDSLSPHFALCFVNMDFNKNHYLLGGNHKNSCFLLKKSAKRNQLSFSFEEEGVPSAIDEEKNWTQFKENMSDMTVDLMGEINFLFPVKIQTYEILKPLFLEFANMEQIIHRLILPHEIEGVDALRTQLDYFEEELMKEIE